MRTKGDDILYHTLYNQHYGHKDESFINDLNIYEVFKVLDFTKTVIGKQYLYHTLCTPKSRKEDIENLETGIQYLNTNESLKKSFETTSNIIIDIHTYLLPELIFSKKLEPPKYFKWVWGLLTTELAVLVCSYFYSNLLVILLPLFFINTFIHLINKNRLYLFRNTYRPVSKLLEVSLKIKGNDHKNLKMNHYKHWLSNRDYYFYKRLLPLPYTSATTWSCSYS